MKLIQWNSDAYDQDLVERTSDACQGKVDVVIGCLGLGAPLQRSFKCLNKGGVAFVTDDINEKVLKSLQKLAEQHGVRIVEKPSTSIGTVDDLKNLLNLVAEKEVRHIYVSTFNMFSNEKRCSIQFTYRTGAIKGHSQLVAVTFLAIKDFYAFLCSNLRPQDIIFE